MNNIIPFPRVVRCLSAANASPMPIVQGELINTIQYIWNKFNLVNGQNLAAFRHNIRDYLDENVPITQYESQFIRGLLSDPSLQLCIAPAGTCFRWDNRASPTDRKCIYMDEAFFFLFTNIQSDMQLNALRIIFMATLLHGLGDYITSWAQPAIDFSPTANRHRFEGGMKTEYAFFGGFIGGYTTDGVHYDYARIRMFNSGNLPEYWMIPDHVAREYYASETINKYTETMLTKLSVSTGPTNTIRQMDLCCGWHRLVWRPIHRPPQDQQQGYQQGYYGQGGQQGQQGGSWGYLPPQQQGYSQYGAAPGTNFANSGSMAPSFPPPSSNFNGQFAMAFPPAGNQTQWADSWVDMSSWGNAQNPPNPSSQSPGGSSRRESNQRSSGGGSGTT